MTSLKTSIKTITYLSDIGCLEIQGASLVTTSENNSAIIRTPASLPVLTKTIPSLSRVRAEASFRNNPPGIPLRLCHRNPPVYLRTATFPIIFYVSPRLLCR